MGDALGAPLEGMSRTEIRLRYGGEVREFLPERFGPGAFTDDTQMTIALAEALVASGKFDLDDVAHAFGEWMRLHDEGIREARGYDWATAIACRRLYRGVPRPCSAVDSAGCEAASRAAPIGLFLSNPLAIRDAAVLQGMLTHSDPRALAGAAAVALAVAYALGAFSFDPLDFLRETALLVEDVEPGMAAKISSLEGYVGAPLEKGLRYTGTGASAMEAVPAALLILAKIPHCPEVAIVSAVNAGGETDSIGAMVGTISGALKGAGSLPERWLAFLEARNHLEYLAETIFQMVSGINGKMAE